MYSKVKERLLLYTDCVIVKGYNRTILFDFTRPNNSNFVPSSLYEFIEDCKKDSLENVLDKLSDEEKIIGEEYVNFIIENEFGFLCEANEVDRFIGYPSNLYSPEYIDNCILEIDVFNQDKMQKLAIVFDALLLGSLEIRIKKINEESLKELSSVFSNSIIQSINIYIEGYSSDIILSELITVKKSNLRFKKLSIYNSAEPIENIDESVYISALPLNETLEKKANVINISYHLEALERNTYLYKKMVIDSIGNIKNFTNGSVVGNVYEASISEIQELIEKPIYQEKWFVPKKDVHVCKDCEFRTVCFSEDIPQLNVDRAFYNPSECSYNPYIGKSIGDEGYLSLAECGVISNQDGFKIDKKKLNAINEVLLSE